MQQSNVIVGALSIAFIVFITAKGELPTYIGFLRGVKPLAAGTVVDGATVEYTNNLSSQTQDLLTQQDALDSGYSTIPQVNASAPNPSAGISVNGSLPPLQPLSAITGQ